MPGSGQPAVSVIVPVYNPGGHIDDCIASLLGQSLPPERYEVVFVDDGSTDGTGERLDALAERHGNVRVRHIPNSGWPGRPRNVGLEEARGAYVYFADNDDWLGAEALERLHAVALRDGADVVVGKVVGHGGKHVPRLLFERNRSGMTLAWGTLLTLLAPHKLFRAAFLEEHGIRFPDAPCRLEDHRFVMGAYLRSASVSVVADYPCYHWVSRGDAANASLQAFDPAGYYGDVRDVLDLVAAHVPPGPERERLSAHWYRGKMLGRVGGRAFLRREPGYRRTLYEEIRALALERFGEEVQGHLPLNLRARSRLLREGDLEGLEALAAAEGRLRARATLRTVRREEGVVVVGLRANLAGKGGLLRFARDGAGLRWSPPAPLAARLRAGDLDAADVLASRTRLFVRSGDGAEYLLPGESHVRLVAAGDGDDAAVRVVHDVVARLDPRSAAGGAPLEAGDWELVAIVEVGGFHANARVRPPGGDDPVLLTAPRAGRLAPLPGELRPGWLRRLVRSARRR